MRLRYFIYLVLFMTLSCVKEQEELVVPDGAVTATIPFKAVVQGSDLTRASISGAFGTGSYIFQEGDRLFIVDTDTEGTDLYGVLTLIDGAGSGSGIFEGTLNCTVSPTDETELSATLVGPDAAAGFYSISGEKVTGPTYPSSIPYEAGGLAEYVKKYSHFTSSSTFGNKSFTLEQQTVFVNFSLGHIGKGCLTNPSATEIGISIKSGDPLTTVRTFTGIPWAAGGNAHIGSVNFTGVFKTSDNIGSGQICVEDCTIPITSDDYNGNFDDDQTLSANRYYSVTRTFDPQWSGFRITATANSTNVSFNYYDEEDGIEYSLDDGMTWKSYLSKIDIPLNKNESICVRGDRTNYTNNGGDQYGTPSNRPIFEANSKCYISGDIMSLLHDKVNLVPSAFHGAFSKGKSGSNDVYITYIDINPDNPLILPAATLTQRCYMQMFRNCQSLTAAPVFRAESVAVRCCYNMFRNCTNLVNVSGIELPATILAEDCYRELFRNCQKLTYTPVFPAPTLATTCYTQMFHDCKKLTSVVCLATDITATDCILSWFLNVNTTGTFYCDESMTTTWTQDNKIPANWTAQKYTPPSE